MNRIHVFLIAASFLFCEAAPAQSLKVTGLSQSGNQITITVQNTGASTSFRLEGSSTMTAGSWNAVAGATFTPVAGQSGFHRTTITRTAPGKLFYRVVGLSGTEDDFDGDGLSNSFEGTLGTKSDDYDTDRDGFSDGQEYGFGTNPLLDTSRPVFTDKATVNFAALNSTATEGTAHSIPVQFDRPFTGTVNYSVNALTTVTAGTDFNALSGTLAFSNATTANIPLSLIDDISVSGQRALILDLKLNGNNYFIGGQPSHIVLINDNDAWWTGTLIPASGESASQTFRVKITHQGANTAASFGAGTGSDGLPVPAVTASPAGAPAITGTSVSEAVVPKGSWPATLIADTASRFSISSPNLPVSTGGLLGFQPVGRTLLLNAQTSLNASGRPHLVQSARIAGDYTETLSSREIPLDNAIASQSTTYVPDPSRAAPANAIDRRLTTISHTDVNDAAPSWTLRLPGPTVVHEVVLSNRTDCCQYRFRDLTVQLFSDNAGTNQVFSSSVLNPGNALNGPASLRIITGGVTARVLKVSRNSPAGTLDRGILSLAEVKLYNTAPSAVSTSTSGTFLLLRDIPTPLPVLSKLVPTTP